jgi:hypothetical protein
VLSLHLKDSKENEKQMKEFKKKKKGVDVEDVMI